ncbi:hypothetical protein Kisp01_10190 [Kineosporia sp. NBRC 101677]|nr:hypothetical protein Kisp01_10190 [Kineosporia sp. NBRC 101677]
MVVKAARKRAAAPGSPGRHAAWRPVHPGARRASFGREDQALRIGRHSGGSVSLVGGWGPSGMEEGAASALRASVRPETLISLGSYPSMAVPAWLSAAHASSPS